MKNIILIVCVVGLLAIGYAFFGQRGTINDSDNDKEEIQVASSKVDLSNQGLDKIPEYAFSKTQIEELDVSNNNLTGAIQAEIRHLKNLKVLKASNNFMTGVPAEIGQLQKLEVLDLSNNQLTGLPHELGNLKNLKTLNLSGNDYSEFDLDIIRQGLPGNINLIL